MGTKIDTASLHVKQLIEEIAPFGPIKAERDKVVAIEYQLTTVDGTISETTPKGESIEILLGHGQVVSGLERALYGLGPGDTKKFVIGPREAYGEYAIAMLRRIPFDDFPYEIEPYVGMEAIASDEFGKPMPFMIKEVNEKEVVLDFNHPLAGKKIEFNIKVVGVRDALDSEVKLGSVTFETQTLLN